MVAANYIEAVQAAGGLALLLPPDPALTDDPAQALELIDGLLLVGGPDLDPTFYGAPDHPEAEEHQPERDAFELSLLAGARERDIPVLGICRGMQVINVAAGGSLHQHLPESLGRSEHRRSPGRFDGNDHAVELSDATRARTAAAEPRHRVISHHHQGVDRVGDGLVVSGRSTEEGLVEAVEPADGAWVLGVQWHPEADPDSPFIGALVREAARAASPPLRPRPAGAAGGAGTSL